MRFILIVEKLITGKLFSVFKLCKFLLWNLKPFFLKKIYGNMKCTNKKTVFHLFKLFLGQNWHNSSISQILLITHFVVDFGSSSLLIWSIDHWMDPIFRIRHEIMKDLLHLYPMHRLLYPRSISICKTSLNGWMLECLISHWNSFTNLLNRFCLADPYNELITTYHILSDYFSVLIADQLNKTGSFAMEQRCFIHIPEQEMYPLPLQSPTHQSKPNESIFSK